MRAEREKRSVLFYCAWGGLHPTRISSRYKWYSTSSYCLYAVE